MNKIVRAHLALLTANIIYGGNFTIAKEIMPSHIGPLGFIFLRVLAAGVLYWIVSPFIIREKVERRDIVKISLYAVFGVAANQMLFFEGLALTSPINSALIMVTSPIFVLVVSGIIGQEAVTFKKIAGIVLGLSGASFLVLYGKSLSSSFLGNVYLFVNAVFWGIFLVIAKPVMLKYHPLTVIKWLFLFGTIYTFPFGYKELSQVQWADFSFIAWGDLAYVIILTTFFAYLLNTYPLRVVSPSAASVYIYLQPLFAVLIALAAGKDQITLVHIIAALFIFTGVFLTTLQRK